MKSNPDLLARNLVTVLTELLVSYEICVVMVVC